MSTFLGGEGFSLVGGRRSSMTVRTQKKTVTFKKPFLLKYIGRTMPAGEYVILTEEELLEGLSFYAYRKLQTYIYQQLGSDQNELSELYVVDPDELEEAIQRDGATPVGGAAVDHHCEPIALTSENGGEMANRAVAAPND